MSADEDEELIDEDDLLDEVEAEAPALGANDDCEVGLGGARKACKDCTCGRAEGKMELSQEMLNNPQSSCGSCGLGDAFRCATCPYLGKPSFKLGEKIQLDVSAVDI
mmetsp:Transcript_39224/g.54461  ORF Transcript_39224/g.54461 Transcript_39224/m.54461 type:complete len:107 (-) Transcript_39224:275-595(-)